MKDKILRRLHKERGRKFWDYTKITISIHIRKYTSEHSLELYLL